MQTIKDLLSRAVKELANLRTARLDAEVLLCYLIEKDRSFLYAYPDFLLNDVSAEKYFHLIQRRQKHEPVAYLIGKKEFYGIEFIVTPDVLIPRPETELMIEEALKFIKDRDDLNILDLCTGSACIALALARELKKLNKKFKITASDISDKALLVGKVNAENLCLDIDICFLQSDLFKEIKPQKFDLILSNPPYVDRGLDGLGPELSFEPGCALFAANRGLEIIEKIIIQSQYFLKSNSLLLIEIGAEQANAVLNFNLQADTSVKIIQDLSGLDRFVAFTRGL